MFLFFNRVRRAGLAVCTALLAVSAPLQAQTATPETLRAAFQERFPGVEVSGVRETPFEGLYEVQIGKEVLYADADVNFVIQGALIDARSRVDLTAQRLEELNRVALDSLPLENAIKQVRGNGERVMVVFEDPNCGYCKQLHRTLQSVDNVTVYTLLYPILSKDSVEKSRNLWCASDSAAAWKAWMVEGKVPATAECDTPIDENLALGRQLQVQGTPAIIFADGSRVNGAMPLEALEQKLQAADKAAKASKASGS